MLMFHVKQINQDADVSRETIASGRAQFRPCAGSGPAYSAASCATVGASPATVVRRTLARLALVVAAAAMHGLAVVPHDEVVELPFVDVDEARLGGVLGEIAQNDAGFGHRQAKNGAGVRREIERFPPRDGVRADDKRAMPGSKLFSLADCGWLSFLLCAGRCPRPRAMAGSSGRNLDSGTPSELAAWVSFSARSTSPAARALRGRQFLVCRGRLEAGPPAAVRCSWAD